MHYHFELSSDNSFRLYGSKILKIIIVATTTLCEGAGGERLYLGNEFLTVLVVLACENISISSLFVAENVSRGGTSATQ